MLALLSTSSAGHKPGSTCIPPAATALERGRQEPPTPTPSSARVLPACECCCWLNWKNKGRKISGERNTVAVIYLYFSTKFDTVFHKTLLKNIIQTRRARSPVVWGGLGRAPPGTADKGEMVCMEVVEGPCAGTGHGTATRGGESGRVGVRAVVGKGGWGACPVPHEAEPPSAQAGTRGGHWPERVPRERACPTPRQAGGGVGVPSIPSSVSARPFCPSTGPPPRAGGPRCITGCLLARGPAGTS